MGSKFCSEENYKFSIGRAIINGSILSGAVFLSGVNQGVQANQKSIVAVEPLVCDLVKVIAPPSNPVSCLIDRKKDVHDVKISPRQAQILKSASQIFTLGPEMTPAIKKWLKDPITVVVGVSAIDIEDHDDHSVKGHDDHDDHDKGHGDQPFEWAGIFELSAGTYKWSFAKVDGEYADPAMKMVILQSDGINSSEKIAEELLEAKDSEVKSNNDVLVSSDKAYLLKFDRRKESTVFTIDIQKDGKYAFFTEHMPFEFEANEHFFKDISGNDVEPISQAPETGDDHHHHDHGELDPHVWHDPHNIIKIGKLISKNIKKNISLFDRANRQLLRERSKSVNSILEDLDQWTQQQVSTIPGKQRTIVSKHKAMEYYGDAFGLKTISLLDYLGHSSSLRPQTVSLVVAELKTKNVKALFPEQTPPSKLLRNLSRQTSTPIASKQIFVDGLMPTGNTISVAVHNTCNIVNTLGGSCDQKAGNELERRWNLLAE